MVCEVSYTNQIGPPLSFRKYFKFQVVKPLDVKTKFYNAEVIFKYLTIFKLHVLIQSLFCYMFSQYFLKSDEVYLEAQIQNLTAGPICLEKVALESSHLFSGKLSPIKIVIIKKNILFLTLSSIFERNILHFSNYTQYK